MAQSTDDPRVTVSQIAKFAGVTSSAVSNWRRRHNDFPEAQATPTGRREVFSLHEVETWLRDNRGLQPKMDVTKHVWQLADMVRGLLSSDEMVEFLCSVVAFVSLGGSPANVRASVKEIEHRTGQQGLFQPLHRVPPDVLNRAIAIASHIPKQIQPDLFGATLEKQSRGGEWKTSAVVSDLLAQLSSLDKASSVFDPAAGTGGLLLAAAKASKTSLRLYGQEIGMTAWRIAKQNLLLHGVDADLRKGDSLLGDRFRDEHFDVILCDPPYSAKSRSSAPIPNLQWSFGPPPRNSPHYWWLQYVVNHLSEDGRGYVLLPVGSLFRHGTEKKVRQEMARRGAIEAVVTLPPGAAQYSQISLALWIVKRPVPAQEPLPVLFVDGTRSGEGNQAIDQELISEIARTVKERREGRESVSGGLPMATVKVLDILGADVDLDPSRWVRGDVALDLMPVSEAWDAVARTLKDVQEFASDTFSTTLAAQSPEQVSQWMSIRDLVGSGIAQIIRGRTIKPNEFVAQGVRALKIRDIGDGRLRDDQLTYVRKGAMEGAPLTEPGDIVVSPGPSKPKAAVDDAGGHMVTAPLQIVRFRQEWLDPYVAAAAIGARRNLRFLRGSAQKRVNVQDLELPVLPLAEVKALRGALEQVRELERKAEDMAAAAKEAREALVNLGNLGATS